MNMVRLENRRRSKYQFPMYAASIGWDGKDGHQMPLYTLVLGDVADTELLDPETGEMAPNIGEIPIDAARTGWVRPPNSDEQRRPPPVYMLTQAQLDALFPDGSVEQRWFRTLLENGDVTCVPVT